MAKFTNVSIVDISRGVDQRSAPSAIPEGYSQTLQNVDTNSSGFLSKRPGYEGYYGYLPARVTAITHEGTEIKLTLGVGVNTSTLTSTPIIVYGKLSGAQSGDWSNVNNVEYYTSFTTDILDDLPASANSITVPETRHGVNTDNAFIGILVSDGVGQSSSMFTPDYVVIPDTAAYDITIGYTIPTDKQAYVFVKEKDTAGTGYWQIDTVAAATTDTITIPASTHNLDNFNILVQVYVEDGTDWSQVEPDEFRVNFLNGEVQVDITNSTGSPEDFKIILSAAPVVNSFLETIAANTTTTIIIPDTEPFYFLNLYRVVGNNRIKVIPGSSYYDDQTKELRLGVTNSSTTSESYLAVFEYAVLSFSSIILQDNSNTSASYTDTMPQLTIWGLKHEDLYSSKTNQEGHVTHIDTYRREAEERVIAGLGGNIFAARSRAEVGSTYSIPFSSVSWSDRSAADKVLGPLFEASAVVPSRTRGNVKADNITDHYARISSCELISAGLVKYFLNLENKTGTLAASVDVSSASADTLIVSGMAHKINNGSFKIVAVDDTENSITVENTAAELSKYNETGSKGKAGSFTDQLELLNNAKYVINDKIIAKPLDEIDAVVNRVANTLIVVSGVTKQLSVPTGVQLSAKRTTSSIPLSSTTNFVAGDMCEVIDSAVTDSNINTITQGTREFLARKVRVVGVIPADVTVSSITDVDGISTVITSDAHGLKSGQKFSIIQTGNDSFDGEYEVIDRISPTEFTVASKAPGAVFAGVIPGNTLSIDDAIGISDITPNTTTIQVEGRWIPIEIPNSTDDLPKTTNISTFISDGYSNQDILRSTTINDTMFFTNQNDEVFKFDGQNIYKAGLIPWKPEAFSTIDTNTASIPLSSRTTTVSNVSGNRFKVEDGTAGQFTVGDRIVHSSNGVVYTILTVDVTNSYVFVTSDITGSSGGSSIRATREFKYYFRLNAIDRNNNIVSSATTNPLDNRIELTAAGQIVFRIVGLPEWGALDYDRIEIEVYRTKSNTDGPFYLINVLDLSFDADNGYIDFRDGSLDETLLSFDPVMTALKGSELGLAWDIPMRAEHITATNSRLILGNIKGYPEVNIGLRKTPQSTGVTASDMAGVTVTIRKDSTSVGTTTDMVNRSVYEFVNASAVTITTPASDITRDATTFTVNSTAHGLVAGNWVYMFHSALGTDKRLRYAGWWQINDTTANTFTVKHANDYGSSGTIDVNRYVTATDKNDIPVWIGTDGNYNTILSNVIDEQNMMSRLYRAINTSMRQTDVTISGQETFSPYVIANGGSSVGFGKISITQSRIINGVTFGVEVSAPPSNAIWLINNLLYTTARNESALIRVANSRVLLSYSNYPEIFDNPLGDQIDSDSVVDINAADGQEITGLIPFFGDSVFSSGLSEGFVVVFKTNSVYLLNVDTKEVSRLQTRGQGCTAPYSIAQTRNGIMFANESGVYRLNRDMSMSYVGANVERIWQDEVNKEALAKATGHHYGVGRKYKLSIPAGDAQSTNNIVLVYDHEREEYDGRTSGAQAYGAWTTYTNHNVTGWANLANDAFFGTTDGQVFKIRNANDKTDFRDDAGPIDDMIIELRPENFGVAGIRKTIASITSNFQLRRSDMKGTRLEVITDNEGVGYDAGSFNLNKTANIDNEVATIKSSLSRRKMVYATLKYTNTTKDEDVVLAGVDYRVAGLTSEGLRESSGKYK